MCDNDFAGSVCIGFLVDTSLTNTAPLAYFHDITSAILGNITVEGGAPGSVILNIKGTDVVFTVETVGFKRFQLCREGNEMTLYDGCSAVEPSQPFPEFDPDFQDTDFVGLLRDLTSSQSIFQVICAHYTFSWLLLLSCINISIFPLFRTVSHNSTSSVVLDHVLHRRAWPKCSVIPVQLTVMNHLFPWEQL